MKALTLGVLLWLLLAGCARPVTPQPPPSTVAALASRPAATQLHGLSAMARAMQSDTRRCPFGHASLRQIPALGGCTFWSPEFSQTIICLRCGYAHDPAHDTWEKGSTDPEAFQVRLDALTIGFPVVMAESKPQFYQSVLGTRCIHEGLLYRSAETLAVLEAKLAAYLRDQGISPARTARADAAEQIITLVGDAPDGSIRIALTKMADASKTQVTFEVMFK
jgi:hypothetical protein